MLRLAASVLGAALLAGGVAASARLTAAAPSRLYLTFVSHNEDSNNVLCAPVNATPARYLANRAAVLRVAQTIYAGRGAYDLQSDWEWILRTSQWETDEVRRATTGGNGIIPLLATAAPYQVRVDAHSHEHNGYTYADVAYMLQAMGAPPTGIVGGFIATPTASADWVRFRSPMVGRRYPGYVWQPTALWGGGSGDHQNDQSASGVWRPRSPADFFADDPAQTLINIGNGTIEPGAYTASGAVDVFERLRTGRLDPGLMYTATLMLSQCDFDTNPGVLPYITSVLDAAAPYVASGHVVWATLPDIVRIWREEYASQPSVERLR